MTWVVWRQQRSENVLVAALIAGLALFLVLTGAHMRSVFDSSGLSRCTTDAQSVSLSCGFEANGFYQRFDSFNQLGPWLGLVPGLVGVLLAAPLVLDFDQGTYRLAWTQSITPRRWLTMRLALLLLGVGIGAALLIGLATWWRQPLDALGGRVGPSAFDLEGIVPFAYALFAATAVLAIGTVTRRTGLAVAAGFGAYLLVRIVVRNIREHLIPPLHAVTRPPYGPAGIRHDWVISQAFTNSAGHPVSFALVRSCMNTDGDLNNECIVRRHVFSSFLYEPSSRFWPLQGVEAAIFVMLSAALLGLSVWWIRRRIA